MSAPAQPNPTPGPTLSVPLLGIPVSTIVHILVVIVGGVLLIVDGQLPQDFPIYLAAVEGGNGLLALGRGLDAHSKP